MCVNTSLNVKLLNKMYIIILLWIITIGGGHLSGDQCKPVLSVGCHSELNIDGHIYLECDISSCDNVYKIVYEKDGNNYVQDWIPVFEGFDKTRCHVLNSGDTGYSLKERHDYTTLPTQHILYVNPLTVNDQGKWRCVFHSKNNQQYASESLQLHFVIRCIPNIKEGSHNMLQNGGHASLECDISSCGIISSIQFEKGVIRKSKQWTPVFEGINKGIYRALETDTSYTLKNRNDYTAFSTEHILYINPLNIYDQGKWRCVVYDRFHRIFHSQAMDFYFDTQCTPELSLGNHGRLFVGGYMYFECDVSLCNSVSSVQFEKTGLHRVQTWTPVFSGISKTVYQTLDTGTSYTLKDRNDYTTLNTEHILYISHIQQDDQGEWRCVVHDLNRSRAESKAVMVYLGPASISDPQEAITITPTSPTFTLNCTGTGYTPNITWQKDAQDIMETDIRYIIKLICNQDSCLGTLTTSSVTCLDADEYTGIFTCIISSQPPYTSSQTSPDINVIVPQSLCREEHFGLHVILAAVIVIGVILVVGVMAALIICKRRDKPKTNACETQGLQGCGNVDQLIA